MTTSGAAQRRRRFLPAACAALMLPLALAGCDDPERRAEEHYQRGAAYAAEGEAERALIEFRNVLQLDARHLPGRLEYAGLLRAQGDLRGATGQYLRVVELDPDSLEAHLALAELALEFADYEAVERHAARAYELAPDLAAARALKASVDFRNGEVEAALAMADGVLADDPGSVPAHLVLVLSAMAADDFAGALTHVDAALLAVPGDRDLLLARLAILDQLGDIDGVEAQLVAMARQFPEDASLDQALIQHYLAQGDEDRALEVLRGAAARDPDRPELQLAVVDFLLQLRGAEAAEAELARLVAEWPDAAPFRVAQAELAYALGRQEEAMAALEAALASAEPGPAAHDQRVALARMLAGAGQAEAAAAQVGQVLAEDPRHVGALKLHAAAAIEDDRIEEALLHLRTAAQQAPRDPEVMTLMAQAHVREGARELAGERLARAVEASDFGIAEALRYARFQIDEGRFGPAESTLLDALRRHPEDVGLLRTLGEVHLLRRDPARTRQVAGLLRGLGTPQAEDMAIDLELAALQREGRQDRAEALLRETAAARPEDLRPRLALLQRRIQAGELEAAREEAGRILAEYPGDVWSRLALASIDLQEGHEDAALASLNELAADHPEVPDTYQLLFAALTALARPGEAQAALDAGLAATDRAPALVFLRAGLHYEAGAYDEALALFDELYALDSNDVVVANNLASLLSVHRQDEASLERAFQVGRRLRGTDVPQFQDTYGWILVRRGDYEQALAYLEPAAAALPEDPLVQLHLARALDGLGRTEQALAAFERAIALAEARPIPQLALALARADELRAALDAAPSTAR